MEENKIKLKDYGLWEFEHVYLFDDRNSHLFCGTVCASDVVDYLKLPKTQQVYDVIDKNCDRVEKVLKNNDFFNDFLIDKHYEDASREYYEER